MRRGTSERDARKKLLLLEGQLQRLELMQARQSLRGALRPRALAEGLPSLLLQAIRQRGLGWLPTLLPWVFGAGRARRWVRRGLLAIGAVAAAASWLRRGPQREPAGEQARQREDEKNPGRSRD